MAGEFAEDDTVVVDHTAGGYVFSSCGQTVAMLFLRAERIARWLSGAKRAYRPGA